MPILALIVALIFGAVGYVAFVDRKFKRIVDDEVRGIFRSLTPQPGKTFHHTDLEGLPAPVQRCLRQNVPDGYPMIYAVRLKQTGTMSTNGGAKWFPFKAVQYFTPQPPAFVWWARGWLMPAVWITARDKYIMGRGNMLVKAESLVTVADAAGEAMDQGSLSRYLAECMWFPTALVPSENLHWSVVDDHTARVTLRDHQTEFTMTVTFNEQDDIVQIEGMRCRENDGTLIPWGGKALAWRSIDGVRIASEIEVYWNPEEGYQPYYRGTLTEVEFNKPELY